MSPVNQNFSLIFFLFCFAFVLPFITTLPTGIRDDPFDKFIEFLSKNNCSMPKEVELPFSQTDQSPFSYLATPLKECQAPEALKANLLCKEVFDVIQNITCYEYNLPHTKINSSLLSANICRDFAAIQGIIPKQNEYLSRKLGDNVICKVLCTEKYELLCKTLVWGYDTLAKIKNALDVNVEENGNENGDNIASNEDALSRKEATVQTETSLENHQQANEMPDKKSTPYLEETKNPLNESSLNIELVPTTSKSPIFDQIINKNNSSPSNNKIGKLIKLHNKSEEVKSSVPGKVVTQSNSQKHASKNVQDEDIQPTQQSSNLPDKNFDHKENNVEKQLKNIKIQNPVTGIKSNTNVYTVTSESKNNQSRKSNISVHALPDKGSKENSNSNINIKLNEKLDSSGNPKTEIYSDLNSVDLQEQENESENKGDQTDLNKKAESPKESFISATPETDSKLLESTILPIFPDKNEDPEHQEVKDPEYNSGFGLSSKKDSDVKNSIDEGSSQMSSSSNIQISPENFPGPDINHVPDSNRNYLPAQNYLPEQEDGHFFFYFLSIVLILMAGYLIFHNKQKIIALIVEGRHERRRRSHGAGYKKLETK